MSDAEFCEDYIALDELRDLPECRVLATADPDGLIRFDVTHEYAESLLQRTRQAVAAHQGDGLVTIMFPLDYAAYASLTKGFAQLLSAHQNGDVASKQVMPEPDIGEIAVSVAVNASQMESSVKENYAALKTHGRGRMYGQQFGVSGNGAKMLIQQLEAAVDGHENPMDAVDTEESR